MNFGVAMVLVLLAANAVLVLTAVAWLHWNRAQATADLARSDAPPFCPPVTILKPLKGLDDALEENLESYANLDYPCFQLICAAADADDPALVVARKVAARHPEREISVRVYSKRLGWSPKVSLLSAMIAETQYDLCVTCDSNVRVPPDFLLRNVKCFRDPRVGLVHNPVVGEGERSLVAAIENLHLTCFSGVMACCVRVFAGLNAVTGKNMVMRKAALAAAGGFFPVRNLAADDFALAERIARAGWKVELAPEPVRSVNGDWSWTNLLRRQVRWSALRCRLAPWAYPIELLLNPVGIAAAVALVTGGQGWLLFLGTAMVKTVLDAVALIGLRGHRAKWRYVLLSPVKDLLIFGLWFAPLFTNRINWRGHQLLMTRGSRLVHPAVLARAKLWARLRHTPPPIPVLPFPQTPVPAQPPGPSRRRAA